MDGILNQFSNLQQTTDYICFKIIVKDHYIVNDKDVKVTNKTIIELNKIRKNIYKLYKQLNSKYIWYKDIFNISIIIDENTNEKNDKSSVDTCANKTCYLQGCIRYGANTEDSHYILYLCNYISNFYKNIDNSIDLIINITDHDGDVLLIEAADVIPDYLNDYPDYSMNRVWLINGLVYVIPFKVANRLDYKHKTQ
mgnify:FL=1